MAKLLRPWLILIVLATMMAAAYWAIFRAVREADIREVPLAKTSPRP